MGLFFDMLIVLSLSIWALRLAMLGLIKVETAALALLGLTVLVALARASRMGLVQTVLRIGIPVISAYGFLVSNTNGGSREMIAGAGAIAALLITLCGFYIMFRGVFGYRRR